MVSNSRKMYTGIPGKINTTMTLTASTRGRLRSAETTDYVLPRLRTKFAERGFSYAGPAAWNRLPESIRRTSSQAAFKRQLKTFLFCDAFNIVA